MNKAKRSKEIDAYIARAPKGVRGKLEEVREAIRSAASSSVEGISYKMPAYDKGRVAWFALMKGYIGLYLRPPTIWEHRRELAGYKTTKSAIHIPLNRKIPVALIKRLVRARTTRNRTVNSRANK